MKSMPDMPGMPPGHVHPMPADPAGASFFSDFLKVYTPRRVCMFYEAPVIWLHVISDLLIAVAYYSIPFALVYFVRRRKDVAFGFVFWMFAAFILACGTTHIFGALDVWQPYYRLDGVIKLITALLSVATAIALWQLMPKFLSIPSAAALETTVRQRTAALEKANAELRIATEAERAARTESERQFRLFDTTLSSIRDYTFILDREGRFSYANKVLLDLWGATATQAIGKSMRELNYPAEVESQMLGNLQRVYETGQIVSDTTAYTNPAGAKGHYEYILAPVLAPDGSVERVAGSSRDVTDRKQADADRESLLASERAARAEAERANGLKDEFLTTLSHELRTPLNAILGWSQLLRRSDRAEVDIGTGLDVIERNARVQTQLISDLLDMSRIISGKLRLEVQRLDLTQVVLNALDAVGPVAEGKGVRVERVLATDLGPVRGDSAKLQQVVWNLMTNAIKFTPAGGKVQIALERVNSHVEIVVSDTGAGIAADFLPFVFDRFRQADGSSTRRHGGLGVGLSIAKNIVEAHGGTIAAASPGLGGGATFTVKLPLMIVHERSLPSERQHPTIAESLKEEQKFICEENILAGVTVLIVDDQPDAITIAAQVLQDCHARVLTATSAAEAFEILQRERPDVLVSDIGMPVEDGYDLIRKVRSLPVEAGGATPAAALTAFARSEDRRRALISGFQSHITKPVEPAELIAVVASLSRRTGNSRVD